MRTGEQSFDNSRIEDRNKENKETGKSKIKTRIQLMGIQGGEY